ncbi:MAG: lycopene cyclase domain-containing protein [Candidatus Hodarchaeales archaeon]|jgi:lycopene cyclase domain-containing protein
MLTYLSFLLIFIGIPLILTSLLYIWKYLKGDEIQKNTIKKILLALLVLTVIALIYTTPWDNFLVENGVWFYDSSKVLGIIIGFVPIEEYTFFVVQTLLIGLLYGWFLLKQEDKEDSLYNILSKTRVVSLTGLLIIWLLAFITYIGSVEPLTYMNLILLWGILPVMIQLVYGADLLWLTKRNIIFAVSLATFYLSAVDALAIVDGIWTIRTNTSTGILIGGILPIEEFLFFLTTNILIIFGLTLIIDSRSRKRFDKLYSKVRGVVYRT